MKNLVIAAAVCFLSQLSFSQNVDSARFYLKKGIEENNAKLYAVASKDFDIAIHFDSNLTEAYIANGKTNLEMEKVYEAGQNFEKAYQLEPKNTEVIKELTTFYFNNQQFQKAIQFAGQCTDCENVDRIFGIGYYHLEDYAKAQAYLQKAIAKSDEDAEATYILGRTYLELENEKAAIPQYQKAVTLEPTKNQWMYELGLIYFSQNDYKNALKYFDMASDSGYNKSNDFYENYGFAQLYSGETENGLKTLAIVLDRKPNNSELLNNIAHAMYDTQKYDQAFDYFKKLLDLNPKDAPSLFMAGMTLQKLGQKEKGQKICDNAIAMDPSLTRYRQKKEMPGGL